MKNKWLILTQYYPPEIGAPQVRLRSLAKELKKHGYEVRILTAIPNYPAGTIYPGYENKRFIKEESDGISIQRVWVLAATGRSAFIRLANYFSFTFFAFYFAFFNPKPDVLFVEAQPLSLGFIAILMKWFRGVPYIYNVPDLQVDVAKQMGFIKNEFLLDMAKNLENLFLRQSLSVSTVTHRFIDHFVDRGIPRSQITFLPNGADVDFLKPQSPDINLINRWSLKDKKVILYVGTHAYYHGLEILIEAARLLQNCKDISFLMIGNGPERSRIIDLAKYYNLENVIFGQSPYEEMNSLYSITYLSIATLKNIRVAKEMRLSKIFPSLSCGVPVIYSGIGEAADLISEKGCGISVLPEDPSLLAEAIKLLVTSPELRKNMGAKGRELVVNAYSWSTTVEKWLAELNNKIDV